MDVHSKQQRSFNMSRIKSTGTKPELKLRKYLWSKGLRGYRIKSKVIGRPDIYYPKAKLAIFIDGCFWHMCPKCFIAPKTNEEFWSKKLGINVVRDRIIDQKLTSQKVSFMRFWEHEIEFDIEQCANRVSAAKAKTVDSSIIK